MTAEDCEIFKLDILRTENGVAPVAALVKGVTFKLQVFTVPSGETVRSAIFFFTVRVIGVAAVDIRAFFADDCYVFGIDNAD